MGELETFRREKIREGDPLSWHPMNQKMAKDLQDRQKRGESPRVDRANKRKFQEQQAHEEFMENFPKFQFDRALGHILDGTETQEDIKYVARNTANYEQVIGRFRINGVNGNGEKRTRRRVTATIVEFTHRGTLFTDQEAPVRKDPLEQERLAG